MTATAEPTTGAHGESFRTAVRGLQDAALARAVDGTAGDLLTPLLRGRFAAQLRTVDLAVDECVRVAANDLLTHGWAPLELHTFGAKRLDERGRSYLRDVLAAAAQWNAATDWLTDLGRVESRVWWSVAEPHFGQWIRHHALHRADSIRVAVDVLALLSYLPRTDARMPGAPDAATVPAGSLVQDDRIVARIDALVARANATSFVEEAVACSRKAQELMVRYATVPAPSPSALTISAGAVRLLIRENPLTTARTLVGGLFQRAATVLRSAAPVLRPPSPSPRPPLPICQD